ncbi:MAG: dual specificity protein phosphatase family protein [Planctomycetota bacterium]|jgi:atypical dual specificity phosphatase
MNLDQILPQIYTGSYPECINDVARLKSDFGITAVLSVQTDEDLDTLNVPWDALERYCQSLGIEVSRLPVRDFDREDLQRRLPACVAALSRLLEDGHTVYVHCTAGIGRSPSVVVAYLHWDERWDLEEARDHVTGCRPCSPDLVAIRNARGLPNGSGQAGDPD